MDGESVNSWLSPRVLFAVALAVIGAVIAGQLHGEVERILVTLISMLIALFVAADPHDPGNEPSAHMPAQSFIDPGAITSHPQLQSFIDASNDAILIVDNSRVTAANQFARQLLGINIVGQNVRIAFRHAGAIERLTDPDAQHTGHPIRLTGIGQQSQMWDMRIQ